MICPIGEHGHTAPGLARVTLERAYTTLLF
jgi:hypothetical protein